MSDILIEQWENIIKDIEKTNVPSNCIHRLVLKLDGESSPTQKTININKLRKQGVSSDDIDVIIDMNLAEFQHHIKRVDMFVDVKAVASLVQPITDKLLKL